MDTKEFKHLYNNLTNQNEEQKKQKDVFIIQFEVQDTKFAFFKNQNKNYLCKFSFNFLEQPQRVEVEFRGNNDLQFKVDDSNDIEQIYDLKKFKQYFFPQYTLFKEAFENFKHFLESKNKLKKQQNKLKIVPLQNIINKQKDKQSTIDIDGISFLFNEIKNTFKDTYRVDFELDQTDATDDQKYITVIFKAITDSNYYILDVYLNKSNEELDEEDKLSKDQFADKFPIYFTSLNEAIKTYLNMNH